MSSFDGCEWDPATNDLADEDSEHFHRTRAEWMVGAGTENYRLCADCAKLPRFKRYRTRTRIVRRQPAPSRGEGTPK